MLFFRLLLPLCMTAAVHAADLPPGAVIFQNVCSQCHGTKGEGKAELKAPSIAGLPAWYSKNQIASFREGRRGHDAADPQAFLMASIARTLTAEQLQAAAEHVEKLPPVIPSGKDRDVAGADLSNGLILFQERCMECHRYNGSGEIAFQSAPLTGLQNWYLNDQLHKFKTGRRGAAKGDINGAKMVLASGHLYDANDVRDVVAYIMTLNPEPAKPAAQSVEGSPFSDTPR